MSWQTFFWSAFRQSRNAMTLVDGERRLLDVNDATADLLGHPRERLLELRLDDIVPTANRDLLAERWERFVAGGEPLEDEDGTVMRADGTRLDVEYAAQTAVLSGRRLALFVILHAEAAGHAEAPDGDPSAQLTPREREVVDLLALGMSGPEIAEQLVVSHDTVRTHVRNAMEKTGSRTRAQLVARTLAGLAPVP